MQNAGHDAGHDDCKASLSLEAVTTRRGGFTLPPVTLAAAPGEWVYIAGPNGRGKSTLLALVAGLLELDGGRILRDGELWSAPGRRLPPWQRGIGLLLQDPGLWPHLSVRAQCRLVAGRRVAREVASAAAIDARIGELATALDVPALLDRRPAQLSGGEAQRCALVRALAPGHTVLLLDEPYSQQHADGIERIDTVIATERARGAIILVAGHRSPPGARTVEISPQD